MSSEANGPPAARSPRALILVLGAAAVIAAAGAVVGSQFSTPAQQAADAVPPHPSLLTMPVQRARLKVSIVFRASVADASSFVIPAPSGLEGSLPVVTALNVAPGAEVRDGQVLAAVAGRPVLVMQGQIPAYRTMAVGDVGIDVQELQEALTRIGLSIGSDAPATFGTGTAAALAALYRNAGYTPVTAPVPAPDPARNPKPGGPPKPPTLAATAPLGEVAFVPTLPAHIVNVRVHLGGRANGSIAAVGSGRLVLSGTVGAGDAASLHAGEVGTATSDLSGRSIRVRIVAVRSSGAAATSTGTGQPPTTGVRLVPVGPVPPAVAGQNLRVSIDTASTRGQSWIVPVAAVVTTADGKSFVMVVNGRGREQEVPVAAGLVASGREAVTTLSTPLARGEPVVIGTNAAP